MKKINKIFTLVSTSASLVALPLMAASCGPDKDVRKSKRILIAVDGAQKDFYRKVMEDFKQTDSYKDGYRIETIDKGVFDALNFGSIGASDTKVVPDIFYAPQDRVTELASSNAVSYIDDFNPNLFDEIATELGATAQEKQEMRSFGSVSGLMRSDLTKEVTKLLGLRHNQEGIVLASRKDYAATKAELTNASTDTMEELVKSGKLIARLQDFWYGNGILGGTFKNIEKRPGYTDGELMKRILYFENSQASSGFLKTDKYHNYFKEAIEVAAKLYYPIYQAAYVMTDTQYGSTPWAHKGISKEDLKACLTKDMGQVQNKIWELMSNKKIDYAWVGTWDIQNTQKTAGANTFVNIEKLTDDIDYIQAAGSWSFLINSRNNGSTAGRTKAISEVLKTIFKTNSYYAYFKQDSKVPFVLHEQDEVKTLAKTAQTAETTALNDLAVELGYADFNELLAAAEKNINKLKSVGVGLPGDHSVTYDYQGAPFTRNQGMWSTPDAGNPAEHYSSNPGAEENNIPKEFFFVEAQVGTPINDAFVDPLNAQMEDSLALRNTIATILGLSNLADLHGTTGQPWQIGDNLIKSTDWANYTQYQENANNLHIRKVEKFIFGANGDSPSDRDALFKSLKAAIKDNTLEQVYTDAEERAMLLAQSSSSATPADEATVKRVTRLYLNAYVNVAKQSLAVDKILIDGKFLKKDNTPSNRTNEYVADKIIAYQKSLAIDKIIGVVSSDKTIANNGLGILKTQDHRIDNSNPQFGAVAWQSWNDLTFGNVEWLQGIKAQATDLAKFTALLETQLDYNYQQKISVLNSGNSTNSHVIFEI